MDTATVAGLLALVLLLALGGMWAHPVTRPILRQLGGWIAYVVGGLLGALAVAVIILVVGRPHRRVRRRSRTQDDLEAADRDADLAAARADARHSRREAEAAQAVADPDPAAGWAALDSEEREMRGESDQ